MAEMNDEMLVNIEQMETPEGEITEIEAVTVTPIIQLFEYANSNNIADLLDENELRQISDDVIEQYKTDSDSMAAWGETLDAVRELNVAETAAKSEPWEGAANYKANTIKDAINQFGDRCSLEILSKKEICRAQVIGEDPTGERGARADRVAMYQNFDIRHQMDGWIEDQDKLFYQVAEDGSIFKKTYFDPSTGNNVSEVIKYPNFAINQSASEVDSVPFSIIKQFTEREIITKQRSGIWSEIRVELDEEGPEEEAVDSEDAFIEQHTFLDLDGDGYPEPYIVTVYYRNRQVVRILPRYDINSIIVKSQGMIVPLGALPQPDISAEVVEIIPDNQITHYGFIPSTTGFLCVGYGHLLMSYTAAINKASNSLLNAGHLSNLQGGYLAKGVRKKMGIDHFKPGQFKQTNIEPNDLQNAILPLTFKEPSQTLLNLREMLKNESRESSSSVDISQAINGNTPASTTLSLLQEQLMPTSSIIARTYRSMGSELEKLYALTARFGDPQRYMMIVGQFNMEQDFSGRDFSVIPVGNPELSSKVQRVMQAQAGLDTFDLVERAGGNTQAVVINFYKEIGWEDQEIQAVFPAPPPHALEQQNALQEQNNMLLAQQNELQSRLVATEEQKNMLQAMKQRDEASKRFAEIEKIRAETILTYEKAESEQVKNQIDMYTAEMTQLNRQIELLNNTIGGTNV